MQIELLFDRCADVDLEVVAHIRRAIEIQNALDQLFRMHHLFNRFLANQFRETLVAPVLAHLGMQEILIDSGQFRLQYVIQ
jgi:hypothetical protein